MLADRSVSGSYFMDRPNKLARYCLGLQYWSGFRNLLLILCAHRCGEGSFGLCEESMVIESIIMRAFSLAIETRIDLAIENYGYVMADASRNEETWKRLYLKIHQNSARVTGPWTRVLYKEGIVEVDSLFFSDQWMQSKEIRIPRKKAKKANWRDRLEIGCCFIFLLIPPVLFILFCNWIGK